MQNESVFQNKNKHRGEGVMSKAINQEEINHPKHYNVGKIEVIDIIEDWKLGFHLGNAIKYILRAKYKGSQKKDLQKAIWYIERYLRNCEKENKEE